LDQYESSEDIIQTLIPAVQEYILLIEMLDSRLHGNDKKNYKGMRKILTRE